jgi:hypothetical protein
MHMPPNFVHGGTYKITWIDGTGQTKSCIFKFLNQYPNGIDVEIAGTKKSHSDINEICSPYAYTELNRIE